MSSERVPKFTFTIPTVENGNHHLYSAKMYNRFLCKGSCIVSTLEGSGVPVAAPDVLCPWTQEMSVEDAFKVVPVPVIKQRTGATATFGPRPGVTKDALCLQAYPALYPCTATQPHETNSQLVEKKGRKQVRAIQGPGFVKGYWQLISRATTKLPSSTTERVAGRHNGRSGVRHTPRATQLALSPHA